jgi:hypothetical protein
MLWFAFVDASTGWLFCGLRVRWLMRLLQRQRRIYCGRQICAAMAKAGRWRLRTRIRNSPGNWLHRRLLFTP